MLSGILLEVIRPRNDPTSKGNQPAYLIAKRMHEIGRQGQDEQLNEVLPNPYRHARMSRTTLLVSTPVSRKSRPWDR